MLLYFLKKHCQFYMFNDQDKEKVNKTGKNSKENGSRRLVFISIARTKSIMGSQLEVLYEVTLKP